MKTLLLIDANSLIHRCFHALPPLTTGRGVPSQALYGLSSILLRVMREERQEYIAACFDRPEPTFRKKKYDAYKAQRPPAPDTLISQIIGSRTLFREFGIPGFEEPGFEADDIIATLAERFGDTPDLLITILSGDLDALQLVRRDTTIVRVLKTGISQTAIYDEKAVRERFGVSPEQLIEYKALVGDQSDNIKGLAGVGPKTAASLLSRYGTLEAAMENLPSGDRIKEKLVAQRDTLAFMKELVTLRRDAPVRVPNIEALRAAFNADRVGRYFEEWGFGMLARRLKEGAIEPKGGKNLRNVPNAKARGKKPIGGRSVAGQGKIF